MKETGDGDSVRRKPDRVFTPTALSVRAAVIADVIHRIDRFASRSTVLITGETGTGKELVARAVPIFAAPNESMPFIKVNCAALPDTLVNRSLRRCQRGVHRRDRHPEEASSRWPTVAPSSSTKSATMSIGLQAKLLRVLQEREIEPLGSERTEHVDVRVIAATNRDLRQLVDEGRFQDDLFYRLHVIPIVVPPLRERVEDIPLLVAALLC